MITEGPTIYSLEASFSTWSLLFQTEKYLLNIIELHDWWRNILEYVDKVGPITFNPSFVTTNVISIEIIKRVAKKHHMYDGPTL